MVSGNCIYKAVLHLVMMANAPHLDQENEALLLGAFNEGAKATLILLLLSFGIALPGLVWSAIRHSPSYLKQGYHLPLQCGTMRTVGANTMTVEQQPVFR
jgi:hypothetical protein